MKGAESGEEKQLPVAAAAAAGSQDDQEHPVQEDGVREENKRTKEVGSKQKKVEETKVLHGFLLIEEPNFNENRKSCISFDISKERSTMGSKDASKFNT